MAEQSTTTAPYGTWPSVITSELMTASAIGLGSVAVDGDVIWWRESRATEGGRNVLMRRDADGLTELTPAGAWNVRTRVNEYGGGGFLIHDDIAFFSNFDDQRVYRQARGSAPEALTMTAAFRYADFELDRGRDRLICVRDDHRENEREPTTTLAVLPLSGEAGVGISLVSGHDFFAAPRLSPDGRWLVWLAWDHPLMPWDATALYLAEVLADGSLGPVRTLIDVGTRTSVQQPQWGPNGELYCLSDRSGFWNLYRVRFEDLDDVELSPVFEVASELAGAPWQLATHTYDIDPVSGELVFTYNEGASAKLAWVTPEGEVTKLVDSGWSDISRIRAGAGFAAIRTSRTNAPGAVVRVDRSSGATETLRRTSNEELDPDYFSIAQAIEFPTAEGRTAFARFYAPRHPTHRAETGELPPLLMRCHGGPTSSATRGRDLTIHYHTSRGIAFVDVDYGGSTGYGREYRERLQGKWGLVDVEDSKACVAHLVAEGLVDPERVAITGGSAGGFTVLNSLLGDDSPFAAGASHYGVTDLCLLARDTHKFESRYLDSLIGQWPEDKPVFVDRSPISHVGRLNRPMIFFQGDDDRIVPPNQSERMANALREKGVPVAYLLFEGEQHGFRRAENIKRCIDGQLYFMGRIFGFEPDGELEPVDIDNL